MSNQLTFNNQSINVTHKNGQIWLTSGELAKALKYKQSNSVSMIFNRNEDEFTEGMSQLVNLTISGNYQKTVRIFSLRGCHLIAMFAKTEIAKEFRKWVLDILDKETHIQKQIKPEKTHTFTLTHDELCSLAWLYKSAEIMRDQIETVHPALEKLHSDYSRSFFSMAFEYKGTLSRAKTILDKLTAHINPQNEGFNQHNWQNVLQHVRN